MRSELQTQEKLLKLLKKELTTLSENEQKAFNKVMEHSGNVTAAVAESIVAEVSAKNPAGARQKIERAKRGSRGIVGLIELIRDAKTWVVTQEKLDIQEREKAKAEREIKRLEGDWPRAFAYAQDLGCTFLDTDTVPG